MQRIWVFKTLVIVLILMILEVALLSINSIVDERNGRQMQVVQEIASSNYGPQTYSGLILVIPYIEEWEQIGADKRVEKIRQERYVQIFPKKNDLDSQIQVSTKSRGLFKARVFDWSAAAQGEFAIDGLKIERNRSDSHVTWGDPIVSLPLSDARGLIGTPSLEWNGKNLIFEKGSGVPVLSAGLHAKLPPFDLAKAQQFKYALNIGLRGTQSVSIIPFADDNHLKMTSPWPHPSFGGQFLPNAESQQVSAAGFSAQWNISALASNAQQQLLNTANPGPIDQLEVRFIEPIDIYSLSDRALKYGFLFIMLTFCCFLLFEVLKRLPIHPAQYLMVGLALATFFLLLVALSEHIAFAMAYAGASLACITLLTVYLSAALRSGWRGFMFGTLLTTLYGALYGLLISEDNALLLGALLVFALLALAMISTRKVDWYALGQRNDPA